MRINFKIFTAFSIIFLIYGILAFQNNLFPMNYLKDMKVVDDFVISKDVDEHMAILPHDQKKSSIILLRSNKPHLVDDFFNYANYISEILKKEYILQAKDEINFIKTQIKDLPSINDAGLSQLLTEERFIIAMEKGADVVAIEQPTMPKKVSAKLSLVLSVSIVLGVVIGGIYVLIYNAIRRHKEH